MRMETHSMGVMCSDCEAVLVEDNCRCGTPHGHTYQSANEWAERTWPYHGCFRTDPPLPPVEPFERIYGYDVEEYDPYGDGRDDREL